MSNQVRPRGTRTGRGNKVIATTLLEALAVRGLTAAHDRARRFLDPAELTGSTSWLRDDALTGMMAAAEIDSGLARSVGHRLVSPDAMGIALYGLGLASPEKAYRRVQVLLPRERAESSWLVEDIGRESATMSFGDSEPGTSSDEVRGGSKRRRSDRGEAALCALRTGMLEGIPGIYGLLPARVRETTCRSQGSDACRYEITWRRTPRTGLLVGAAAGTGLTLALIGSVVMFGFPTLSVPVGLVGSLCASLLAVTLGSCHDLHRQLKAVAAARTGHLALFDQADDALALKLDALARVETKIEEGEEIGPRRASIAVQTASSAEQATDMVVLLADAIEAARSMLPDSTRVLFEHDEEGISIECEPVQIEQVIIQLLRNASAASAELSDSPEITVTVSRVPGGVEFTIEDRGVGLDPSEIDEVFDPFFGERQTGVDGGFGLPVCLRIVERHGGEMRFEVEDRAGTRVVVFLPESHATGR